MLRFALAVLELTYLEISLITYKDIFEKYNIDKKEFCLEAIKKMTEILDENEGKVEQAEEFCDRISSDINDRKHGSDDMSRHKVENGRLLQMNKRYSQLKIKQKEKISGWMYDAYKWQMERDLPDEDVLKYVYSKIEKAEIWIPRHEVEQRYKLKKKKFEKRLAAENVPKHLYEMEGILDRATQKIDALEKKIEEFKEFQSEIQRLEVYYTSQQWKDDFAMDEKGKFPEKLKRGILSEDGIYNLLERNKELMERLD